MNNLVIKIFIPLAVLSITSCVNLYDLKNPNERKQIYLRDIIRAELYLQETGDTEFSPTKTGIKPWRYIQWGLCTNNLDAYERKDMSISDFRNKVPKIIEDMKGTLFYKEFVNPDNFRRNWQPFRFSIKNMSKFVLKEQKNIKIVKVTDNYICVSIKY